VHAQAQARFTFHGRRQFVWKTVLLAATTLALVPILLSESVWAAQVYLWALVVIHVAGIGIVAYGVKRHHIAPDLRGLAIRVVAILILVGLLYLASQGLERPGSSFLFWGSLFAIWALHTLGLALLHIRGRREASACPFA
jgi:hypothetical protein